jgi:pre-mRNA-splicing factor CWC22
MPEGSGSGESSYSGSSYSRSGSRSPSRSPPPRRGRRSSSRSPPRRGDSRSPPRRGDSRSPPRRGDSRSPKRRRSPPPRRSPPRRDRRSASPRERRGRDEPRLRERPPPGESIGEETARPGGPRRRTVEDPYEAAAQTASGVENKANGRTGGLYMPPWKLAQMMKGVTDKSSEQFQRMSWESLKKVRARVVPHAPWRRPATSRAARLHVGCPAYPPSCAPRDPWACCRL